MAAREQTLLGVFLAALVILSWLTVFSGAYIIYPWYRAVPPEGLTDLSDYPRRLLLVEWETSEWHNIGMEWKEHVAWLAPIAMTMVAYVTMKYRRAIVQHRNMRVAVLGFAVAAFVATGIAGIRRLPEQIRACPRRRGNHSDAGEIEMSMSQNPARAGEAVETIPNGPGAAAILAAGIGCAAVGIVTLAAEMSRPFMTC